MDKSALEELLSGKNEDATHTGWIVSKLPLLMRAIEHGSQLSGSDKKKFVIDTIRDYILKEDNPGDEALLYFAEHVLPQLIDTLVLVDTNRIKIKARKCLASCFIA